MKNVLVTGAFGNVGRSTLLALAKLGYQATAFDWPCRLTKKAAREHPLVPTIWGDIRDENLVTKACQNKDAVIHLAAIIPPRADQEPELARSVNIEGTRTVLKALASQDRRPRLVFSSSVATYGDRVRNNYISTTDPLCPCADDEYAKHKVACEELVRASGLSWVICRLSYIVWRKKLAMDALMYRMPLDTSIEVCHTLDTGLALARAADCDQALGKTYNLGGGTSCRTTFRDYLDRMMELFGLGGAGYLKEEAFSQKGYHCGFLETQEAQELFHFQNRSLEDYYAEVAQEAKKIKPIVRLCRPLVQAAVLARSPYLRAFLSEHGKRAVLHAVHRQGIKAVQP